MSEKPEATKHLADWRDLTSGLSLIYLGPHDPPDDLTKRALVAMELGRVEDMEHVTALLMAQIMVKGREIPKLAQDKWSVLSKQFHEHFCSDCHERRMKGELT